MARTSTGSLQMARLSLSLISRVGVTEHGNSQRKSEGFGPETPKRISSTGLNMNGRFTYGFNF